MPAAASAWPGSTEQTSTSAAGGDAGNGAEGAGDHQDPLDPEGVAGRRRCREAEQLGKTVVAASPTERALRSLEGVVPELEDGVAVVVEPAHQPVVADRVDAGCLEIAKHGGEVVPARRVERVPEQRRARDQPGVALAVEQPERVGVQAAPAVVAQRRLQRGVVLDQRGAVSGPILGAAQRVDLEMDAGDTERLEEAPRDLHDLGVQRRRALTDALDADLGELMLPSRLGPFGTEERARRSARAPGAPPGRGARRAPREARRRSPPAGA